MNTNSSWERIGTAALAAGLFAVGFAVRPHRPADKPNSPVHAAQTAPMRQTFAAAETELTTPLLKLNYAAPRRPAPREAVIAIERALVRSDRYCRVTPARGLAPR